MTIDINCDMGESFGNFSVGNDEALMPYISSANIACGFHAGDPKGIKKTIQLALKNNVQIGAHPSYPDLSGFGRRKMNIPKSELIPIIQYQLSVIKGLTESLGGKLSYVKPHGALYNNISTNEEEAITVIEAVQEFDDSLAIMGLAGSHVKELADKKGIHFIAEAFADRRYDNDGKLLSRNIEGAVIESVEDVATQVLSILLKNKIKTYEEKTISILADSICIHGDNRNALPILKILNKQLSKNGISIKAFSL